MAKKAEYAQGIFFKFYLQDFPHLEGVWTAV